MTLATRWTSDVSPPQHSTARCPATSASQSRRLWKTLPPSLNQTNPSPALQRAQVKADIVVLDPPRAGCGVKAAARITELKPRRIVYVSCNPTTFAREASVFLASGYDLKRLTLIDQFPNTYHIELAAAFELR